MADPADERAAYLDAMRRAEEAAGISRDPKGNELASGETPAAATPELPEAVPVQASDQPLTPEPAAAEATATSGEQQQPAAPAAPAQPQTVEELQVELARTQARLEEKDSFIGRQSSEVGELRAAVDEMRQQIAQQTAQPATPQAPQMVITQELIDTNPAQAAEIALAQGNEQALAVAFDAWKEDDPTSATVWLVNKQSERREQALRDELEATRAEVRSLAEPIAQASAQTTEQAQWSDAFTLTVKDRPDFLQHAERLLEEVAPKFPHIVSALSSADAKGKAEVLTVLYDLDKFGNPEQVKRDMEQQAAEAVAEAEAARAGAAVVAGQTTAGQPGVEKTSEELEQEAYINRMGQKPSLSRGWTGRS